jgi:RHS repeat-associated protein
VYTPPANAEENYQYNKQLQPVRIQLGTTASTPATYCLVYNYYGGSNPATCLAPGQSSTGNDGNTMGYWFLDNASVYSHAATYTYDHVNRLATAVASPFGSGTWPGYNFTYSYDAYGNMTCVLNLNTKGTCAVLTYASNNSNQLATIGTPPNTKPFTYDAAGNMQQDPSSGTTHTYQWDAEGRMASVDSGPTWSFTYDALGHRVYWPYSGGSQEHLFDPAGNWLGIWGVDSVMPFVDHLFAVYWNGDTYFYHKNNLRSTTVTTNHSGAWVDEAVFSPWGVPLASIENFADLLDYDSKTDNDIVAFRIYSPSQGRWVSPDSLRGDVTNPQSLNLYPYVTDNPTTLTDPLGLCGCGGGSFGFGEGGGGGGGGCGGGGYGGGGRGGRGRRPTPPIIPIPGPGTWSQVGGGLFSNPFSFASIDSAPPTWFGIIDSLPLPPWSPLPPDSGAEATTEGFQLRNGQQYPTPNPAWNIFLCKVCMAGCEVDLAGDAFKCGLASSGAAALTSLIPGGWLPKAVLQGLARVASGAGKQRCNQHAIDRFGQCVGNCLENECRGSTGIVPF